MRPGAGFGEIGLLGYNQKVAAKCRESVCLLFSWMRNAVSRLLSGRGADVKQFSPAPCAARRASDLDYRLGAFTSASSRLRVSYRRAVTRYFC
jgi:hypothetical protein